MTAGRELRAPLCIPARHPSLSGHFPDQPLVPGVVILDRLAATLENAGLGTLRGLRAVKFMAPLRPDQQAEIHATIDARQVRFRVESDGAVLVSGEAELA